MDNWWLIELLTPDEVVHHAQNSSAAEHGYAPVHGFDSDFGKQREEAHHRQDNAVCDGDGVYGNSLQFGQLIARNRMRRALPRRRA